MKGARQTQLLHQQKRKITIVSVGELIWEKSSPCKRNRKSRKGKVRRTRSAEILWLIREYERAKPERHKTEKNQYLSVGESSFPDQLCAK